MLLVKTAQDRLKSKIFSAVHGRNLVYNTCWEDPALDRVALDFKATDRVLVITSAGCNALDYLLAGAGEVNAVDVNPIQNALLELKAAAIQALDYDSFFSLFGKGICPQARAMYLDAIRHKLSEPACRYWDRYICFFMGKSWRKSFYYRGSSGLLAKLVVMNLKLFHRLAKPIEDMLEARTIAEQTAIYETKVKGRMWTPWLRWFLSRTTTLSLLGVPEEQKEQIVTQYPGALFQYIRDCLEAVLTKLPFHNNYFWRVYLQGFYTPDCCPEYLKRDNFARLKNGLLGRLKIATCSLTEFLRQTEPGISKLVLLDHMDWMSIHKPHLLVDEWNAMLQKARPNARVIYRSAGLKVSYLDHLHVQHRGRKTELGHLLRYHPELAAKLHVNDRVHTYGSFYIADLPHDAGNGY
jgi:S-adenosylmethionine-diacylglycerol 3-amino-3-carboxypropyl transferase